MVSNKPLSHTSKEMQECELKSDLHTAEPHSLATGRAPWYVTIMCEVIMFSLDGDRRTPNNSRSLYAYEASAFQHAKQSRKACL